MKKIIFFFYYFLLLFHAVKMPTIKNKFEYKKIEKKGINSDKKSKEAVIIINSSDLMKFDQNELRVFEGQEITLTLNHTGKNE